LPRSLIVASLINSRPCLAGPRPATARGASFVDSRRICYGRAQNSSRRESMDKGVGLWLNIGTVILVAALIVDFVWVISTALNAH